MIFSWYWLKDFQNLTGSQVLLDPSWAIISGSVYCKSTIQHFIYIGEILFYFLFLNVVLYMTRIAEDI